MPYETSGKVLQLACRGCSAKPRVRRTKLLAEADAARTSGRRAVFV